MTPTIKLLPKQVEFYQSPARYTGYIAGYGAGKTYAGVVKAVLKMLENIYDVAYYLPTYQLIQDIALPRFEEVLHLLQIPARINHTTSEIFTAFGTIKLRSFDKPWRIIGYEVGYSVIDEADTIGSDKMEDVFKKVIARNRLHGRTDKVARTDVVSTPEGFGWVYDFFVKRKTADKRIIRASTFENPFLPESYIQGLLNTYDEAHLRAYLHGEFVNLEGNAIFYAFDRETNVTNARIDDFDVIHVGMDFNVGKMASVFYGKDGAGRFHAVYEITGLLDTLQMARAIKETLRGRRFFVYPDASGSARSTAAGKSDFDILRAEGLRVRAPKKNPSVGARMAAGNKLLENGKWLVNVDMTPTLVDALEKLVWKSNGQVDKESGLDHIADAATYPLFYLTHKANFRAF